MVNPVALVVEALVAEARVLETICPYCGYSANRTASAGSIARGGFSLPKHGDVSLCINCGQFGIFNLHIREPTEAEAAEIAAEPECQEAKQAWDESLGKDRQ